MLEMSDAAEIEQLMTLLLDGGLKLVGATRGWISRLDYTTGDLNIVAYRGEMPRVLKLSFGKGITGNALRKEEPITAKNVNDPRWKGIYAPCWTDTISEMAIPILLNRARVRIGKEITKGMKPIGVLNIESPYLNFFSQTDENCLWSLAQYAGLMIERLEFDRKLNDLRAVENRIANEPDYNRIMTTLLRRISATLEFDYVNILMVNPDYNCIQSEYVTGISRHEEQKFKKAAIYSLNSKRIYTDIVKSGQIEVPDLNDRRLDKEIARQFRIDHFIRVFVPMIAASGKRVIGVVEAGYNKEYRRYIYDRDVQMLKYLIDYAAHALQQERAMLIDTITHELRKPTSGIRNNASFLQRRFEELDESIIYKKLDDLVADGEIILYQIAELEYALGRRQPISKLEKTLVYRDIVIKTLNQIKPLVSGRGFNPSRIEYNPADSHRILVLTDRARLNQVVFNLLENSLKYAEPDPAKFRIKVELEEDWDYSILKFQDWGIGIGEEYKEKIFERSFRTPEAKKIDVTGSGLGMTISREIMNQLGGHLRLTNNYKPTEFEVAIPKRK
jgi:signal transduction histidine kinase